MVEEKVDDGEIGLKPGFWETLLVLRAVPELKIKLDACCLQAFPVEVPIARMGARKVAVGPNGEAEIA